MTEEQQFAAGLIGDRPGAWDVAGEIPVEVLRRLGSRGLLCAEVPEKMGGLGLDSVANGELTAYVGSLCSSTRSIMTSHGMAAWMVSRFGDQNQRRDLLAELTSGRLAAVGFSEPGAGSDLAALTTEVRAEGDDIVVSGRKMWVTGAKYAVSSPLATLSRPRPPIFSGTSAQSRPREPKFPKIGRAHV